MVHLLSMRDFAFMDKREVKSFDVMSVPENRETGWILEVSLRYSEPLHNIHNSLPLASVKRVDFGCRAYRMLSNFSESYTDCLMMIHFQIWENLRNF